MNKHYLDSALHDYLNRSGGVKSKMETDLHMAGYKLLNVRVPTAGTDAANKQYVDAGLETKLDAVPQVAFNQATTQL